jgi:hypothetical protein
MHNVLMAVLVLTAPTTSHDAVQFVERKRMDSFAIVYYGRTAAHMVGTKSVLVLRADSQVEPVTIHSSIFKWKKDVVQQRISEGHPA